MFKKEFTPALYAILAAILFGASAPISKLLLTRIDPIFMASFLYLGSGIGLALLKLLLHFKYSDLIDEAHINGSDIPWLAIAVISGGVLAPILLMFSLKATPGATASLLLNFESVATSLIAILVFKESADKRVWSSILLITLGSILLSLNPTAPWGFSWGALGIIIACIFWGIDNNFTCKISLKDPMTIVIIKGLCAGSFSLVLGFTFGSPFPLIKMIFPTMILGFLSYGMSIFLFIKAMRALGAARTSALFSTAPFIGSIIALSIFNESQGKLFFISALIIVVGVVLLLFENHGHSHIHTTADHNHRHNHYDSHHNHYHNENQIPESEYHTHSHAHESTEHTHLHKPDIHHRHSH
ncbi:MAG: EamA family transporter [Firmicutes bacterium HGW-Firmicutes-15]|nr:MAG: EamA family transporter [Firmicutes bacterium HGW-Firmicutes-15]